jgi:hypothetical protein
MVKDDFVRTPKYVTEALLERESFEGGILEPSCGDGAISNLLLAKGYQVTSFDKENRGYGIQRDLFDISEPYENIITNPPFTQQVAICKHLLSIYTKKMALLWYVKNIGNVLEGKTGKGLKSVYIINQRIDWVETKLGWLFAWYIWEKGYEGDVTIRRIERGLTPLAPDSSKAGDSSLPEIVKVENTLPAESG